MANFRTKTKGLPVDRLQATVLELGLVFRKDKKPVYLVKTHILVAPDTVWTGFVMSL